jgi:hypothetical protein
MKSAQLPNAALVCLLLTLPAQAQDSTRRTDGTALTTPSAWLGPAPSGAAYPAGEEDRQFAMLAHDLKTVCISTAWRAKLSAGNR